MNGAGPRPLLLVTRPEEELARTVKAVEAAGFAAHCEPLLAVEPRAWEVPPGAFDALLFTSARTPGVVLAHAPALLALPAWCVGAHTAAEAERLGFRVEAQGETDGSAIVRLAAARGVRRMLHPGGEARAPLEVPGALELVQVAVYGARALDTLSTETREALAQGRVFASLLFSARTASLLRKLLEAAGLGPADQRIVALSPAVAAAAGEGWRATMVARAPGLDDMLAAARALWQGDEHG